MDFLILGDRGVVGAELKKMIALRPEWNFVAAFRRNRPEEPILFEGKEVTLFTELEPLVRFLQKHPKLWVLSALPADAAEQVEPYLRRHGARIISNASFARMLPEVPLWHPKYPQNLLAEQIESQKKRFQGGFIACQSNCCVALIARALQPLLTLYDVNQGPLRAHFVTMQSLSGAGMRGPLALQMVGNVLLDIPYEARKIAPELKKMCPELIDAIITAQCHRVATVRGHIIHFHLTFASSLPGVNLIENLYRENSDKDTRFFVDERALDHYKAQPSDYLEKNDSSSITISSLALSEDGRSLYGSMIGDNLDTGAAGAVLSMAQHFTELGLA